MWIPYAQLKGGFVLILVEIIPLALEKSIEIWKGYNQMEGPIDRGLTKGDQGWL